ncbi:hypothetical protein [Cellulomonas shaoxiangyii]|uniref:Uncharacterized protein n=1 Tax=Cellulomonas shaoxiangyii TaxID=2566013 RepID=A0A4P7SK69_9CELL|nr:hypothetical protein [Cellulomonas shaoxiangyii]QCB94231.1 hypothetical protein E5225_12335 [Cellulomonas shaoxiangyii]TGY86724.1 hypothetical protein E5226_01295 [Cellulomonas shaoxiangyii]
MTGPWPDHPGDLFRLVAPPHAVAAHVVSQAAATGDARSASGLLYLAAAFTLRLEEDGAVLELNGPEGADVLRGTGSWQQSVPELVAGATARVRDALPARYLDWFAARSAMPPDEALHDAPDVTSVEQVLALVRERFGDVMSEPEVTTGDGGDDTVRTRLYDVFDLRTGLERPRGNFFRALRVPQGFALGTFPGEPRWSGTTPGSVRRAYRVLDEYCRARLDLPPRADDEETP